ncbi:MAG: F0F1 ATP synthase subunit epsilon [bacterium]
MQLKILQPYRIVAEETDVVRIVAETREGSIGLLPQRLDFVASLVPGILVYQLADESEMYCLVDEGILMKTGAEVMVSVRNAVVGTQLDQLRAKMQLQFVRQDQREMNIRSLMDKVEIGLISRLAGFYHEKELY